ncbi:MAG TPA: DUF2092 domain-containing protein [Bryobacteraceae bacterium]|nr:DUF2092 domain-containing protein [Bryobacteraceae bacterium]
MLAACPALPAQNARNTANRMAPSTNTINAPDLEPVAVNALKAMSSRLREATSFSFTAHIMREEPGTNGQMLDFFKTIHVQVQRPNKMKLEVASDTSDMDLWYDGKNVTLMPATAKIYTTLPGDPTLDATLTMLKDKVQAHTPLIPFLSSDPYSILSGGLQSANEVGIVNDGNEQFLHLAFTEPDADWQLWLTGPNQILPRRMAIVYKKIEGQPRVSIEFSNWNLNAEIPSDAFVFLKPQGAMAASWEALKPRNIAQGGRP